MNSYLLNEVKRSIMSRPQLSALVIATMAIGIALLMTMKTTVYQHSQVPVPHISEQRYLILTDSRSADADPLAREDMMPALSWYDAQNIARLLPPTSPYSMNFNARFMLESPNSDYRPVWAESIATDAAFFSLFDTPFLHGSAWSAEDDDSGRPVIVLTRETNERLFGGLNSVGKVVDVNGVPTTVVGVLDDWQLNKAFFDRTFDSRNQRQAYLPVGFAVQNNLTRSGYIWCDPDVEAQLGDVRRTNLESFMNSDCGWINLWAAFASTSDAQMFDGQLHSYVQSQKDLGRYPQPEVGTFVGNINEQVRLRASNVEWEETLLILAQLFFLVCIINTVGILLAKFLTNSKRISLYRALGATRTFVLKTHLLEVLILGGCGAVLGLLLSLGGLELMFRKEMYQMDYVGDPKQVREFFRLDWYLVLTAIAVGIGSIIVAGLYPIWKICHVSPATQLKE